MNKAPSFFKFFITELNSIDMKIPIAFTRRMDQALPEKVFLRDRHNEIWLVKVAKVGDCWYFVDGWDKFVIDNSLSSGDLMLFEYFCHKLFNVKLYGPTATEKNVVRPSTLKDVENEEEISEYDEIDNIIDHRDGETEGENLTRRDGDNEDDRDDKDEETDENEREEVVPRQVNNEGAVVGRNNTRERLENLYPRCYGMEIFEAGLAEQPRNPYFVSKIMQKRKSDLFIPQDVIKDHSLNLGREIILVDPSGREFSTKCRKWKDGRSILSGGWRRLCRVNLVRLEDSCICEFVQREEDPRQFLHIRFVRANI